MLAEEGVLSWEEVAWEISEVSDLLLNLVLLQGTSQGQDPRLLPSCYPDPEAHLAKSDYSQGPLQLL